MYFSPLFSTVWGIGLTNTGFLVAIVALACILGAEIAGISILISKLLRARRARYERNREETEEASSYRNYAVASLILFGAVPQASYIALTVLAVLTAVAAVLFLVLLIVFRACSYDFASLDRYREEQARKKRAAEDARQAAELPTEEEPVEEETLIAAEDSFADAGEEQRQEAYTPFEESVEEEPLAAFAEEPDQEDGMMEIENTDSTEVAVAPVTQTATETAVMPAEGEPAFADGTRPYKVVEKVVTETYKEVYKETPPASAAQPAAQSNPATDAVMEKLADFLDYELQKRKESDSADTEKENTDKKDSVQVFAASNAAYDDDDADDEEDEDEDDLDEGEDGKKEDDEDSDDEENDTEGDHFTGNERIIGFDEETGCYIVAHYRKSFEAKLIQARPNIKKYYSELKNALLSYKGSKNRISWTADSFHNGRTPIAKINVKTRILELYLALDPASLEGTVYRGKDVGSKKKYADTPFQYKLRTPRKFKWAMELVQRVCEEHGLSPIDIEHVNYEEQYPFDTTDNLVARNLIKEYIRQEKPATSFELAPDHVPAVPDEDESVIPANANFSWEFDNEVMEEKEPEPITEEEPKVTSEPEPEPTPEPTPEPAPAPVEPAPTVVRETVKVTEMRYTERYYADAKPTYEQVVTTSEPIEAEAVPADATVETVVDAPVQETDTEPENEQEQTQTDGIEDAVAAEETAPVDVWGDLIVTEETEAEETADEETETVEENTDADELFFEEASTQDFAENEETEEVADAVEETQYTDESWETEEEAVAAVAEAEETEDESAEEAIAAMQPLVSEPEPISEPAPTPRRIANPSVAVVDICTVESYFEPDDVVKLESLKVLGLVLPTATVLKIYASGALSKPLTVEANHFTLDAIKAISDADGDAVMVR